MVSRAAHAAVIVGLTAAALAGCASAGSSKVEQGLALYRSQHYAEAQDAFDVAIRRNPNSVAAYVDRGAARVRLGDVSGALADYTRALELSPLDPDIYYNRGNTFVLLGRPAEALADYARAIELRPDYAAAYYNRGIARMRDDPLGARADWTYAAAIEGDPAIRTAMLLNIPPEPIGVAQAPVAASEALSASPPTLSSMEASRSVTSVDARALAVRGVAREIDGDREGARADLLDALVAEPDAVRRAVIERLLRFLDAPQ